MLLPVLNATIAFLAVTPHSVAFSNPRKVEVSFSVVVKDANTTSGLAAAPYLDAIVQVSPPAAMSHQRNTLPSAGRFNRRCAERCAATARRFTPCCPLRLHVPVGSYLWAGARTPRNSPTSHLLALPQRGRVRGQHIVPHG